MTPRIPYIPTTSVGRLVGIQQVVNIANPAAGSSFTYTLPGGYYYRPLGGSFTLTTSATAANRVVLIRFTDGTNLITAVGVGLNVTASTVQPVYLAAPGAQNASGLGSFAVVSLPNIWLLPAYTIGAQIQNIQAADTITNIVLWLEALDYGALGQPDLMPDHTPAASAALGQAAH